MTACASTPQHGQESNAGEAMARCNELMDKKAYEEATTCYEILRSRFGGSGLSDDAELKIADISFEKKEYLLAAESYRAFAKLHPAHSKLPYIYYKAGLSYLRESPKAIDRDQQYLDEALGYLEIGLRYFPTSQYKELTQEAHNDVLRRLAARELYVGKFYFKHKEYLSSLPRFAEVADKYEGLGYDEEALYLLAKAYIELDKRDKAFEVTAVLKNRYPNSKYLQRLIKDLDID
jgi:outer membrane protein assembly factor BamD